jgi:hypothetical protein
MERYLREEPTVQERLLPNQGMEGESRTQKVKVEVQAYVQALGLDMAGAHVKDVMTSELEQMTERN